MEETVQKKGDLAGCVREIWRDYKMGKVDYETLRVYTYTKKYGVQQFPKNLIAPLLLKRSEPTDEDAGQFRAELNQYRNSRRGAAGAETRMTEMMDEKMAVAMLKGRGYRVMKRTTAYIDL